MLQNADKRTTITEMCFAENNLRGDNAYSTSQGDLMQKPANFPTKIGLRERQTSLNLPQTQWSFSRPITPPAQVTPESSFNTESEESRRQSKYSSIPSLFFLIKIISNSFF